MNSQSLFCSVTKIWRNAMKSALMGHTPVYSYTVASKMLKHLTDITPTVQNAEQSELLSELWINHADLLSKLLQKVRLCLLSGPSCKTPTLSCFWG